MAQKSRIWSPEVVKWLFWAFFVSCIIWTWKMVLTQLVSPHTHSFVIDIVFLMTKWSISWSSRVCRYTELAFFIFSNSAASKNLSNEPFYSFRELDTASLSRFEVEQFLNFFGEKKIFDRILENFFDIFSRKIRKSRKFFRKKNSSSQIKVPRII